MRSDTIVAIATAYGMGAISIIRLSGANSLAIAKSITKKTILQPRVATLSKLYNTQDEPIDEAVVIYFKSPKSYTGEDIVEFQCHGGLTVANMVLNTAIDCGAVIANSGEFTKRAYLNGKIDISKVETISCLLSAQSEDAVKLLSRQLTGELKLFVDDIKKDLISILSNIEVNIDYANELLPSNTISNTQKLLENIKLKLENLLENSKQRDGLMSGFNITIVGKPNVGKSSFLNSLLKFERAIVSDIAGTTRDTITHNIKIGTHIVNIVDTAGIRESKNDIETIGIQRSIEAIEQSDIVVAIFDNSRVFDENDKKILDYVAKSGKKTIKIINKIDLTNKLDREKIGNFICINCKLSIKEFETKLENILNESFDSSQMALISTRQINIVQQTLQDINESFKSLKDNQLEIFAFHINESLNNISKITKSYSHDEMLDVMFGEFCLGK
ncbi:MAG: tRNA uridine-5-carboxymethylaminomethyl(34) synthesis GTPase MnmE [Campylobacteraceae bacterium 4484_166]|nr:MAG: tRNA uridine-5-carboxymethylaminomethyl(34) synthesis GTPase MnmE [Campylobacteraceae bacterium 4484_166]